MTLHQATRKVGQAIAPIIIAKAKEKLNITKGLPKALHKKVITHVAKGLKRVVLGQKGAGWSDLTNTLSTELKRFISKNKKVIVKKAMSIAPVSVLSAAKSVGVDPAAVTEKLITQAASAL
jgi:hypothetical protein